MTLGLHLLLYWQAKHSLPYLKFKLSNPKVQFNLFLAEFIWLTCWSSFSCEEEVPDSAMNGDTTWTLCTKTDGDRFVSDLPAPSSAEAILMLSGDQPTRQYSIFLANTSHYWLIWMRLTVNSLGLMGWRTSFYMHFAHPGEKDFHLTQGCLLPFCNIERRNGGADTSVYITCMNMISSFCIFSKTIWPWLRAVRHTYKVWRTCQASINFFILATLQTTLRVIMRSNFWKCSSFKNIFFWHKTL